MQFNDFLSVSKNKYRLCYKKGKKFYQKTVTALNSNEARKLLSKFVAEINKKID